MMMLNSACSRSREEAREKAKPRSDEMVEEGVRHSFSRQPIFQIACKMQVLAKTRLISHFDSYLAIGFENLRSCSALMHRSLVGIPYRRVVSS